MQMPKKDKPQHEALKPHIYLFDMMAEKLGKDLEVAVIDGEVTPEEVIDAIHRCSDCGNAEDCAARLPAAEDLDHPFHYCKNQALFDKV